MKLCLLGPEHECTSSAVDAAAAKSAGEARPSRIVKISVTSESESELAERGQQWTAQQWAAWRREFEAACLRWKK